MSVPFSDYSNKRRMKLTELRQNVRALVAKSGRPLASSNTTDLRQNSEEQFELTTGRKRVYNELTGAQKCAGSIKNGAVDAAAMPFCAIDGNIDHLQTQFEARLRELEDKKDAELRTAMKNMASGVRKLEEQLKSRARRQ